MRLVTAKQMQEMDQYTIREFGIPGQVLMETAGKGAVDMFLRLFAPDSSTRIGILAGRGNNGGDGFVMARFLANAGIPVTVFLMASRDKVAGDAKINLELYQVLLSHCPHAKLVEIPDEDSLTSKKMQILHQDILIDALLGTGLNAPVTGRFFQLIQWMNESRCPVFAVDIPSGLNADTGKAQGIAVRADATATFAHAKAGHILYPGNVYTGKLEVIDIGIPGFVSDKHPVFLSVMEMEEVQGDFPSRRFDSHKGSFGHVLVIAGSPGKTGAAALCANAAARSGAGLVTLGCPESVHSVMEHKVTEPMSIGLPETEQGILGIEAFDAIVSLAKDKQVLALGPGMGTHENTKKLVAELVQSMAIPMVLDADALNCLSEHMDVLKNAKAPVVITPHPGEMARLCGKTTEEIQNDRVGIARAFTQKFQVILVLKGAQTLVALPNGEVFCCPVGNPGMASGGMGDVLTGIIAGLVAQKMDVEKAVTAGVYVHGLAGDMLADEIGEFGFLASDIIETIPFAMKDIMGRN